MRTSVITGIIAVIFVGLGERYGNDTHVLGGLILMAAGAICEAIERR